MIEKRQKEWHELEQKAVQMLNDLKLLPIDAVLKFYRPILRLWTYPSFEPYSVCFFCEPNFETIRPQNLKVIRAIWNQNEDYRRLSNPLVGLKKGFDTKPRIEVKAIEIEKEAFENVFFELQRIPFPAFANYRRSIGIDGVRYGIETIDFTHRTTISWWSAYPKEWQELVEWFEKTIDFLQTEFSKTDAC